jgi:hypothetical protein
MAKEAVVRLDSEPLLEKVRDYIHGRIGVLGEVAAERVRQDERWGEQNHPDGTGPAIGPDGEDWRADIADQARITCDREHRAGRGTWAQLLEEEHCEALAENDPQALRRELIQVAAVAVAWVEAIDRRSP